MYDGVSEFCSVSGGYRKGARAKPHLLEEWAHASNAKRESGDTSKFKYPDLDVYSTFFAERAESSKTVR